MLQGESAPGTLRDGTSVSICTQPMLFHEQLPYLVLDC